MTRLFSYRAYDVTLSLPFACPMLPAAPHDVEPDVLVTYGSVPRHLAAPIARDASWEVERGRFLFRGGSRSGRFLVEEGRRVTVERNANCRDSIFQSHFAVTVLAAVMRQRGQLVLHANSAVTPAGAVVFTGEPGAGKSTTLAALVGRGCQMLSDDVTVIAQGPGGELSVLPGVPHLYLCDDAVQRLGVDTAGLELRPVGVPKTIVPVQSSLATAPAPLRAFYFLSAGDGDRLEATPLAGVQKHQALQEAIYGPMTPEEHPALFGLLSAVGNRVPFVRLRRPAGRWSVDEVVERILTG